MTQRWSGEHYLETDWGGGQSVLLAGPAQTVTAAQMEMSHIDSEGNPEKQLTPTPKRPHCSTSLGTREADRDGTEATVTSFAKDKRWKTGALQTAY